jgi:hypothetical protein
MPELQPHKDGVRLVFDADESHLFVQLAKEYASVLEQERSGPVHERLYPAAYEDDNDEAKYKDLIGDSLSTHKLEALATVTKAVRKRGTDVIISVDEFDAWLQTITDMRLVIGTRLDVDEARMSEVVSPRDPDAHALAVLHWLGWLTEGLIEARNGTLSQP